MGVVYYFIWKMEPSLYETLLVVDVAKEIVGFDELDNLYERISNTISFFSNSWVGLLRLEDYGDDDDIRKYNINKSDVHVNVINHVFSYEMFGRFYSPIVCVGSDFFYFLVASGARDDVNHVIDKYDFLCESGLSSIMVDFSDGDVTDVTDFYDRFGHSELKPVNAEIVEFLATNKKYKNFFGVLYQHVRDGYHGDPLLISPQKATAFLAEYNTRQRLAADVFDDWD